MSEDAKKLDKRIVAVVVVAGLLTGAVITYYATALRPASGREEPPPLLPEHQVPYDTLYPQEAEDEPVAETAPHATQAAAPTEEESVRRSDAERPREEQVTDADRRAIAAAEHRAQQQGVEEHVELDDHLYVSICAKLVIAANDLQRHEDAAALLLDYTAQLLADARVDAEDFHAYTREITGNPRRADAMRERILREAEKRTQMKIEIDTIPGIPQPELDIPPQDE